jgi:hypothetical protein
LRSIRADLGEMTISSSLSISIGTAPKLKPSIELKSFIRDMNRGEPKLSVWLESTSGRRALKGVVTLQLGILGCPPPVSDELGKDAIGRLSGIPILLKLIGDSDWSCFIARVAPPLPCCWARCCGFRG